MWPPEIWPIAYTTPTMTSMKANEIIPRSASEKTALLPAAITPVAAADPAPTYTRHAVPSNSARSFYGVVGPAAMRFARPLPLPRGLSHCGLCQAARGGRLTSLECDVEYECRSTLSNDISKDDRSAGVGQSRG